MKSSDKGLRFTRLNLSCLNLVMLAAQISAICLSAVILAPARSMLKDRSNDLLSSDVNQYF